MEQKFSHNWSVTGPGVGGLGKENYSVRWSGYIKVPSTTTYDITIGADDGYRLLIDGETVADGWTAAAFHSQTVSKSFSSGKTYKVQVDYYQKGGEARVEFTWKKKGDTSDPLANYLKTQDLVVACIGFNSSCEGEGSDRSFNLPQEDKTLLETIAKTNKPTVVFVNAGGAVEMQSWQAKVRGIFWAFYGGQQAGTAAGELLFGLQNPSGHLPMTFERAWANNPTYNSYHDPDCD